MNPSGYAPRFGWADASDEDVITPLFYEHIALLERLKLDQSHTGTSVVIGLKGTGKTAIRKKIVETYSQGNIVWTLSGSEDGMPVASLDIRPAEAEAVFLNHLLSGLVEQVRSQTKGKVSSLSGLQRKIFGQQFAALFHDPAAEGGAPFLKLKVPLNSDALSALLRIGIDEYRDALLKSLGSRPAYILIDDPHDVFPGIEDDPSLIEGLVNAVIDLNRNFHERVHTILFMPTDMYALFHANAKSADKTAPHLDFIVWSEQDLIGMLAKRIAVRHGLDSQGFDVLDLWAHEFDGSKRSLLELQYYLLSKCVNGPRDLIALANRAYDSKREAKITKSDVDGVLADYSQDKLDQLDQVWSDEYPGISEAVYVSLGAIPSFEMPPNDFKTFWSSEATVGLEEHFGHIPDYFNTSTTNIIRVLYELGVIGYKGSTTDPAVYVATDFTPRLRLDKATLLVVHPAFQEILVPST